MRPQQKLINVQIRSFIAFILDCKKDLNDEWCDNEAKTSIELMIRTNFDT